MSLTILFPYSTKLLTKFMVAIKRGIYMSKNVLRNKIWLCVYTEYLGNFIRIFFLNFLHLIFYFIFGGGCHIVDMEIRDQFVRVTFLLPPCGSQELHSSLQARWQASLSAETSDQRGTVSVEVSCVIETIPGDRFCEYIYIHTYIRVFLPFCRTQILLENNIIWGNFFFVFCFSR